MSLAIAPAPVVVDASVAVGAVTGEPAAMALWERLGESTLMLLAPGIVWAEIGNALLRGKGMAAIEVHRRILALAASGLESADRGPDGFGEVLALAERHGLTVYDAAYLELALDIDAELATLDATLARAAKAEGVPVVSLA